MSSKWLWYITRATGITTFELLTLTMVMGLVIATRSRSRTWPGFVQQELHRRASMMAVVLVIIHVVTSVLDTYVHIGWWAVVVPFTSPYARLWVGLGAISMDTFIAVFLTSVFRTRIAPSTWRAIHWLAYACWPLALIHTIGIGTDWNESHTMWFVIVGVVSAVAIALALTWRLRFALRAIGSVGTLGSEPTSSRPWAQTVPDQFPRSAVTNSRNDRWDK